ncbi:MAG TPA: TonB-dependent receptor [Candidatus Acidoferrum sp.]|nr:TonB-dependent receptor [Candidatus Acidoferrum sp.]
MRLTSARWFAALLGGVCILALSAAVFSPSLSAQNTYGTISGSVADSSGGAIPGAVVTLTNSGTSASQTITTGADGLYSFVNVLPGDYRLDVEKPGFKHFRREPVVVQVQQDVHIAVAMEIGATTQTVEVTAQTPLLQSSSASLGQVIGERKSNEIPLNGRNIFNLITLSPAAIAQGGSGGSPVGQNPFSWGNYQVGGSFANQSAEYLDGQPLNIGYINLPIIIPTQDSIGEFKVQYNNLGAEWGKFSGGVVNLSTKSGTNQFHGQAYEYLRNKVLNAVPYNFSTLTSTPVPSVNPPYVQNQYGAELGGPVIKDKTFFYVSWEQFRLRQGASPITYTVPLPAMFTPNAAGFYDFSSLCPGIAATGTCPTGAGVQLYDPYTVNQATGARQAYLGNLIPAAEASPAALAIWKKLYPQTLSSTSPTDNFTAGGSIGGNTNEFVTRIDQNINNTTRLFGRFSYFGLTDLPTDPYDTGFCADRCAEKYHTKALALDLNHQFSSTTIFDLNVSASRFVYLRAPINSGFDLTSLGWAASYNDLSSSFRTPPTPAFAFPNDVGKSQGAGSAIGDHNAQYNFSPQITLIRGKHTLQFGAQFELGYDNYYQTNIASGAFAFSGIWTADNPKSPTANTGFPFADFLLGLGQNQGSFVNQTEGVAQVPAQTAGKQYYRALYGQDTWRVMPKLTITAGLRYELQGPWSERFNNLTYWNPTVVNATVTGCGGTAGSLCLGDAAYVQTGINGSRNNIPLDEREWSPRLGVAYSLDQKTVIRAGYGIFFIPNYISFGLNPDNDVIGLATTPFTATTNAYLTPFSTLNGTNCTLAGVGFATFSCADTGGPFGSAGYVLPPGRNAQPSLSSFVAANGSPTLAPYADPKPGYMQQYNLDVQRELPDGWFVDAAYAGARGVHLQQYSTNINQVPDAYVAQAAAQCPGSVSTVMAGCTPTIGTTIANPMAGTSPNPTIGGATIFAGQLDRPYPQYNGLSLAGYGCCKSDYNSFQLTVQKRFQGGGTFLAAYTNSKLLSNTDTLTSWLESTTGGVGAVQDYNNLNGEYSLSSQDVSQRLVVSYVYDLPFGHGQKYMSDATGVVDKLVSGWGVDGVTTFQKGFPLKINWGGAPTPLEALGLGISNVRPDAVGGCNKGQGGSGSQAAKLDEWFNTSCFAAPPAYGYGSEARVDSSLRAAGINNWDIAIFKTTNFGPDNKLGLQFRTEFFNTFNRVQFGFPGTGFNGVNTPLSPGNLNPGNNGFGSVTSQVNNPRLIQFALKFLF